MFLDWIVIIVDLYVFVLGGGLLVDYLFFFLLVEEGFAFEFVAKATGFRVGILALFSFYFRVEGRTEELLFGVEEGV